MNKARRKGTAAETAVCEYLREHFPYVERRALNGSKDRGDVAGIPGVVLEVKAEKSFDLAGWVKELEAEMVNDNAPVGAVIAKKRGTTNVGDWYAVLPVNVLLNLLREWAA